MERRDKVLQECGTFFLSIFLPLVMGRADYSPLFLYRLWVVHMKRFIAELDRIEKKRYNGLMEKVREMPCYKCVWSTFLENKIYCPFRGCIGYAKETT